VSDTSARLDRKIHSAGDPQFAGRPKKALARTALVNTNNPRVRLVITTAHRRPRAKYMKMAATVKYDLIIARQEKDITGRPVEAMTINGQLPGLTLRFTEGDRAVVIRVHNGMDVAPATC